MKKTLLCLFLMLCLILPACGDDANDDANNKNFRNDASVIGLAINAEVNLKNAPDFVDNDVSILTETWDIAFDLCDQYTVKKADGKRLDEYGIFHCKKSETASTLFESVRDYVNARKKDTTTLKEFKDADTVKNGKVAIYGNYVVYTFLADDGNEQFHQYIESLLATE